METPTDFVAALARKWCPNPHNPEGWQGCYTACQCERIAAAIRETLEEAERAGIILP